MSTLWQEAECQTVQHARLAGETCSCLAWRSVKEGSECCVFVCVECGLSYLFSEKPSILRVAVRERNLLLQMERLDPAPRTGAVGGRGGGRGGQGPSTHRNFRAELSRSSRCPSVFAFAEARLHAAQRPPPAVRFPFFIKRDWCRQRDCMI